jgi:hypothetical protein
LTTFPSSKHDDQTDSTSQALDWAKQTTYCYGVLEYYRQEALRIKLRLQPGYCFMQWDEDDEIIAVHSKTGRKIRWKGQGWADYNQPC